MRVEGPQGRFGDGVQKDKVGGKKHAAASSGVHPSSFVEELQSAVEEEIHEEQDLNKLVAEVDDCGRKLLEKPDTRRLQDYKESVKRFMLAAIRRAYRVKVVEGRGPNPKIYIFVEKIELKLEDLAREVLSAHRQPLRMLAQLEELRGLLLDLQT